MVVCPSCEKAIKAKDAIDAWNALPRAPQWTTYDGTEKTLPEDGDLCLIQRGIYRAAGVFTMETVDDWTGILFPTWVGSHLHFERCEIGDRWTYWPKGDGNDA